MIPRDDSVNEIYMNRVFLGDIRIFNEAEVLNRLEFSHILTVELVPVPLTITSRFPHIAILQVSWTNKRYNCKGKVKVHFLVWLIWILFWNANIHFRYL